MVSALEAGRMSKATLRKVIRMGSLVVWILVTLVSCQVAISVMNDSTSTL